MGALETFDAKQTNWSGLWWHKEYNGFSSAAINLAALKNFKGTVRLFVRKNRYYNGGENGRPNYVFCLKDANSSSFTVLEVEDEPRRCYYSVEDEGYYDEEGNRLYTGGEVRSIINGTVEDVKYGVSDPYDIVPSDFI